MPSRSSYEKLDESLVGQSVTRVDARAKVTGEALYPGDWGVELVNGMDWLVRAQAVDETRQRGRGADAEVALLFQRLMPVDALRIRGRHNAANALAALALACSTGAPLGPSSSVKGYCEAAHLFSCLRMSRPMNRFSE